MQIVVTVLFLLFLLLALVLIVLMITNGLRLGIARLCKGDTSHILLNLRKTTGGFLAVFLLCVGLVVVTQQAAFTPGILDSSGAAMSNSIAELRKVSINGRREWISIRGQDRTKPILLFLAGGPGGTQMGAVRVELAELEKHFVVVNWDQPGSGKSFRAGKQITPDIYVEDGCELARYLCDNFCQEKIYLVGESWGSALGVFMVAEAPELFHGLIGTGQMVSFLDTEIIDYELALADAREQGEYKLVRKLEKNGYPPYYGKDITFKSMAYLQYLNAQMAANPEIKNTGNNILRDLLASEYGLLDKVNYVRGFLRTFTTVYPQLYEVDLRRDYTELSVPIYFFLGLHDINAPLVLAEDYFSLLKAPIKEIVWFEHSGHSTWANEPDLFVRELLLRFGEGAIN